MEEKTTKHDPRIVVQALASLGATLLRPNRGIVATGHRAQPVKLLELYEGEYCPFCRHVREALTELDLDARIFPIPKKATRYRDQLLAASGAKKIPFLHDPNTGVKLHESHAIVKYLYEQYGIEGIPAPERNLKTSVLATAIRGTAGMFAAPSVPAKKPLELYSFEGSPYCRLVREVLCELETHVHPEERRQEPRFLRRLLSADPSPQQHEELPAGHGESPQVHRTRRTDDGAVPRGPEYRQGDVGDRRHPGIPARNVRQQAGHGHEAGGRGEARFGPEAGGGEEACGGEETHHDRQWRQRNERFDGPEARNVRERRRGDETCSVRKSHKGRAAANGPRSADHERPARDARCQVTHETG